ncbi:membrane protein [Lacticaseibacillus saniviri JCM 17471 = DSM 24301]|uniref:Membrane protein n=3 Tax=Lacticaseibacillus saniviri TaxID=931533 RepID=A0A0R2MUL2_9LACO|nr:membrane protein [Lacticaseibacillus saniviri JCM 17471 = DSM 24301]
MKKTRVWVVNALVVALYLVLSIGPASFNLASGALQFRLSESLNHLVVFSRKYLLGVVIGVMVFNALFSPLGWIDVVFGGGQSLIGLSLVAWLAPKLPKLWQRMGLNVIVMSLTMILIAIEIIWTGHLNFAQVFWPTYLSLILSEGFIMLLSAPIMVAVDRAVHFQKRIE